MDDGDKNETTVEAVSQTVASSRPHLPLLELGRLKQRTDEAPAQAQLQEAKQKVECSTAPPSRGPKKTNKRHRMQNLRLARLSHLDGGTKAKVSRSVQTAQVKSWLHSRGYVVKADKLHPAISRVIAEWFRLVDEDQSMTLEHHELLAALKAAKIPCDDATITEMIEMMDMNRDGVIDWDEFEVFMTEEFAAGKNLLSGEYLLPSGLAINFGVMIGKLKRDKLLGDVMKEGQQRKKWADIARDPHALGRELAVMQEATEATSLTLDHVKRADAGAEDANSPRAQATAALLQAIEQDHSRKKRSSSIARAPTRTESRMQASSLTDPLVHLTTSSGATESGSLPPALTLTGSGGLPVTQRSTLALPSFRSNPATGAGGPASLLSPPASPRPQLSMVPQAPPPPPTAPAGTLAGGLPSPPPGLPTCMPERRAGVHSGRFEAAEAALPPGELLSSDDLQPAYVQDAKNAAYRLFGRGGGGGGGGLCQAPSSPELAPPLSANASSLPPGFILHRGRLLRTGSHHAQTSAGGGGASRHPSALASASAAVRSLLSPLPSPSCDGDSSNGSSSGGGSGYTAAVTAAAMSKAMSGAHRNYSSFLTPQQRPQSRSQSPRPAHMPQLEPQPQHHRGHMLRPDLASSRFLDTHATYHSPPMSPISGAPDAPPFTAYASPQPYSRSGSIPSSAFLPPVGAGSTVTHSASLPTTYSGMLPILPNPAQLAEYLESAVGSARVYKRSENGAGPGSGSGCGSAGGAGGGGRTLVGATAAATASFSKRGGTAGATEAGGAGVATWSSAPVVFAATAAAAPGGGGGDTVLRHGNEQGVSQSGGATGPLHHPRPPLYPSAPIPHHHPQPRPPPPAASAAAAAAAAGSLYGGSSVSRLHATPATFSGYAGGPLPRDPAMLLSERKALVRAATAGHGSVWNQNCAGGGTALGGSDMAHVPMWASAAAVAIASSHDSSTPQAPMLHATAPHEPHYLIQPENSTNNNNSNNSTTRAASEWISYTRVPASSVGPTPVATPAMHTHYTFRSDSPPPMPTADGSSNLVGMSSLADLGATAAVVTAAQKAAMGSSGGGAGSRGLQPIPGSSSLRSATMPRSSVHALAASTAAGFGRDRSVSGSGGGDGGIVACKPATHDWDHRNAKFNSYNDNTGVFEGGHNASHSTTAVEVVSPSPSPLLWEMSSTGIWPQPPSHPPQPGQCKDGQQAAAYLRGAISDPLTELSAPKPQPLAAAPVAAPLATSSPPLGGQNSAAEGSADKLRGGCRSPTGVSAPAAAAAAAPVPRGAGVASDGSRRVVRGPSYLRTVAAAADAAAAAAPRGTALGLVPSPPSSGAPTLFLDRFSSRPGLGLAGSGSGSGSPPACGRGSGSGDVLPAAAAATATAAAASFPVVHSDGRASEGAGATSPEVGCGSGSGGGGGVRQGRRLAGTPVGPVAGYHGQQAPRPPPSGSRPRAPAVGDKEVGAREVCCMGGQRAAAGSGVSVCGFFDLQVKGNRAAVMRAEARARTAVVKSLSST
ncbi:hypothetical protein Agub_g200 [Astrephomene gubernaculifera]|uniref:EF-hand domain-containing protein n=1 Tax=Astrephomene gubernaculifera TaxID=47775 RepID=A0AAD3DD87_9CHLO|nr:hypothetical protein Agub_g200 [Astrephomene gubernaculifera]